MLCLLHDHLLYNYYRVSLCGYEAYIWYHTIQHPYFKLRITYSETFPFTPYHQFKFIDIIINMFLYCIPSNRLLYLWLFLIYSLLNWIIHQHHHNKFWLWHYIHVFPMLLSILLLVFKVTPFSISSTTGQVVMSLPLSFCSGVICPPFLKDSFARYLILGWWHFFFQYFKYPYSGIKSFHWEIEY